MAYVTGTANSFADLLTAIQNACTANGWTLTGNVLSKGTCFAEVTYVNQTYPCLRVRCGTGQTGGVLSGASNASSSQIGLLHNSIPFTFPMTYFAHILSNPDEVYFIVNYGTQYYQLLAFGRTPMPGTAGTGNWYVGTDTQSNRTTGYFNLAPNGGNCNLFLIGLMFGGTVNVSANQNGAVHHNLDGSGWGVAGAVFDWASLAGRQPSQWNQESALLPIRVYASRPSGFISPVLECAHARFVNIANLNDQQIITLGSDRWKVYPIFSRGTGVFATFGKTDAGTSGHAIRYDGP